MTCTTRLLATALVVLLSSAALAYFIKLPLRLLASILRRKSENKRQLILGKLSASSVQDAIIVGFFHPYCNAGGGGERVLWAAIRATQDKYPNVMCVVYTGDQDASEATIISQVEHRFDIKLDPERLTFMYLSTRHWVAASFWPQFTLLGQSLGSLVLAYDAFSLLCPDVYVDTMGYGFTLPFAKLLFGIPTGAYVHYPTISTDMLEALPKDGDVSLKIRAKKIYWKIFAALYRLCGGYVDVVMTNSSWTAEHIRSLWRSKRDQVEVVFPPVAVEALEEAIPMSKNGVGMKREKIILCIAQFRPEKKHDLIIEAFSQLVHPPEGNVNHSIPPEQNPHSDAKLVLIGSVRNSDDATKVYDLRLLANEKKVKDKVEFVCDSSWKEILQWLGKSSIGVNTMWNEHFGIGVVEYQAAGLISVVHNSGGPKMDIVVEIAGGKTGFHCTTAEEYAKAFAEVLSMPPQEASDMRMRARTSAKRFSEEVFAKQWLKQLEKLLELQKAKGR